MATYLPLSVWCSRIFLVVSIDARDLTAAQEPVTGVYTISDSNRIKNSGMLTARYRRKGLHHGKHVKGRLHVGVRGGNGVKF
jgi:hypothetical protein